MAKKQSTTYVCDNCGSSFATLYGRCPDCQEWHTLKEFKVQNETSTNAPRYTSSSKNFDDPGFSSLDKFSSKQLDKDRISSGLPEMDRVLGGGFVRDEVILLSGEPGVGKSTLLTTVLSSQSVDSKHKVVYVSSEEAGSQIQARCERLGIQTTNIFFSSQKNIEIVLKYLEELVEKEKIGLLVFDSLQGLYTTDNNSLPGSISQTREVLLRIVEFSKAKHIASIVIGHITKDGDIAGPKFLEHMVDCVLFLEGEKNSDLRILRSFKNRFGPTAEIGFFEMREKGLVEVKNPSEFFLEWANSEVGKASIALREGNRVVFATAEALVVSSSLAFPKRVAKGIDHKRLELILAILKKYLHLNVDKYDIYLNIAGGLKVSDPVADLGIAACLYSSLTAKAFNPKYLFVGEVGLLGNIRKNNALSQISKEAKRLGFDKVYSQLQVKNITGLKQI